MNSILLRGARISLLCFFTVLFVSTPLADTFSTTKVGQGVYYKKNHYNSLHGAQQDVYVLDVNLNTPETSFAIRYVTGSATRTTSTFASTTARAVGAVNGQFFDASGSVQFLKVAGAIINGTKPNVHDQQALVMHGNGLIDILQRPSGGWGSLTAIPNILSSGPDLIANGGSIPLPGDIFYQGRNARTAAAITYDNHLLLFCVDVSSTSAGLSLPQVAATLRLFGNIKHAFNLDGGGSTTMWAGGTRVNRPKDGTERAVKNAVVITAPPPANNRVAIVRTPSGNGYWICSSDGYVFPFGDAPFFGSMGGQPLNLPIVGMAARPQGDGYWLVASDGGIFSFGNAPFRGSMGGQPLNAPMVGMASTADGQGYWTVARDGGIFSFNAPFHGSAGSFGINNIVGMAATAQNGYWLIASDGGIFSFNAPFHGSMGGQGLNDFVGMAPRSDASGYWLVRNNGSIYTFGAMSYQGGANEPGNFIGIAAGPSTHSGYWLLKRDGAIYTFGDAVYRGGANF